MTNAYRIYIVIYNNNKLYFIKTGLHRKQYKIQIKFEIEKYTVNMLN